ncbi:MAG TPA: ABC transporter permease [Xanthobacteraceae bacterium]|nr:ABC transporter permease [Xanthobacteraceae bacterium]
MSMTEPVATIAEPWDQLDRGPPPVHAPSVLTPLVPRSSIAGRSLAAVVAIMAFLASLTTGAVMLVVSAANDWQSEVGREVTIQVRPAPGRDIEADVRNAIEIARAAPGIAEVRAYTKEESARLVEPWLGAGAALDDLPIPRLIVVKLSSGARPNFSPLRQVLTARVPTASLDDHRRWIERMRTMGAAAVAAGGAVFALVLAVTVLSVTFATRGAMATNRPIIEVLHYVGATDSFVAGQFQRHFLMLGFKGGALGGGAAILLFGVVEAVNAWFAGSPGGDEIAALFGNFSIGVAGYLAILGQIGLMAMVTALASRRTVNRTLETID